MLLINQKKIIMMLVIMLSCLSIISCTQVAGNFPVRNKTAFEHDFAYVVFESKDIRIIKNPSKMWFDVGKFLRIKEEKIRKIEQSGMPKEVVNKFKNGIYSFKKMEFEMAHEAKEITPCYAFGRLGLVFEKNVVLRIKRGAFNITLTSPNGEVNKVKDEGILMNFSDDGNVSYSYIDSRNKEIEISWRLQSPDYSKKPNVIYFRVPQKYLNWEISSVSVDFNKLDATKKMVLISQEK